MMKKSLRKTLIKRLHKACQSCGGGTVGGSRHDPILEVHHYIYRAKGGEDTMANAVLLCRPCHVRVHQGVLVSPTPITG